MIQLIAPKHHVEFSEMLTEMHELRCRVFSQRLEWEVNVKDGLEIDRYDDLAPVYLLSWTGGHLQGCVRLLPSTGPTMLGDVFPDLMDGAPVPQDRAIWESSRFALELPPGAARSEGGLAQATFELFAGMIEFGLSRRLTKIITVTDVRIERILRRAHWPLCRLGKSRPIGLTLAVAGSLEISHRALIELRQACGIDHQVLWAPVDLPPAEEERFADVPPA